MQTLIRGLKTLLHVAQISAGVALVAVWGWRYWTASPNAFPYAMPFIFTVMGVWGLVQLMTMQHHREEQLSPIPRQVHTTRTVPEMITIDYGWYDLMGISIVMCFAISLLMVFAAFFEKNSAELLNTFILGSCIIFVLAIMGLFALSKIERARNGSRNGETIAS